MRFWTLMAALTAGAFFSRAEEESSAQRLDQAQQGMAEASWPKKPDNRLSPLSGKMRSVQEISPRFYGQDKEFEARRLGEWEKTAPQATKSKLEAPSSRFYESARWQQAGEGTDQARPNEDFQPSERAASNRILMYRGLGRPSAPDWSSKTSALGGGSRDSLRMYEGRLTRVREQFQQAEPAERDLGPGRQEKYSPNEVEKMLSQPAEEILGKVMAQPEVASLPATEGN